MSANVRAADGRTKAQIVKDQWNMCSLLARQITTTLKEKDFLQIPFKERGWGLAAFLKVRVAEAIDGVKEQG